MHINIFLITMLLSLGVTTYVDENDFAEIKIRYINEDNEQGIGLGIRIKDKALSNIWLSMNMLMADRMGFMNEAECELTIDHKPVNPAKYVVYNQDSISFYFDELPATSKVLFTLYLNDMKVEPMSIGAHLTSVQANLEYAWHNNKYLEWLGDETSLILGEEGRCFFREH